MLVDKDIKEIKKQREKLHGRRLDYDYRRGKLKQGTKGVTEEQVTQSYEKLEESIQIAGTSMHNLLRYSFVFITLPVLLLLVMTSNKLPS